MSLQMGPEGHDELQGDVTILCKDHGKLLVNGLKQLLQEDYLVDANVIFKGACFKVHRLILAVFLPTLKDHMNNAHTSGPLSGDSQVLSLDYVANEADDVKLLLEFLYTGRVTVRKERMRQIRQLAKNLNVECLAKAVGELESTVESSVNVVDEDGTTSSNPEFELEEIRVEPLMNTNSRKDYGAADDVISPGSTVECTGNEVESTEGDVETKQKTDLLKQIQKSDEHLQGCGKSVFTSDESSVLRETSSPGIPLKQNPSVRMHRKEMDPSTASKVSDVKVTSILETMLTSDVMETDDKRASASEFDGRSDDSDWSPAVSVKRKSRSCVRNRAAEPEGRATRSRMMSVSHENSCDPKESDAVDRFCQQIFQTWEEVKELSKGNKVEECQETKVKNRSRKRKSKRSATVVGGDDSPLAAAESPTCDKCHKTFVTIRGLRIHQKICGLPKEHVCEDCGFCTETLVVLKQHLRVVHKKGDAAEVFLKCSGCNYTCNARYKLRRHIAWHHMAEREHKCPECEYSAMYKGEIDRHVSRAHRKERKFVCEICGGRFYMIGSLKLHVLTKHQGIKPFKCEHCDKEYADKQSLKIHVQTKHTFDAQRHVCHICGSSYIKRWGLQYHLRHAHGTCLEPLKKPYAPRNPPVQQEQPMETEMPNSDNDAANFKASLKKLLADN